jgi:hypothetical protein
MKRHLLFIITAFTLILLQQTFFAGIGFHYITIDPLTLFIIWWSIKHPLPEGIIEILGAAVLAEILSSLPAGMIIFSWTAGYLTARYIIRHFGENEKWHHIFIAGFVTMEMTVILQTGSNAMELVWPWGIGQAIINSVLAPLFFWCFDMLSGNMAQRLDTAST